MDLKLAALVIWVAGEFSGFYLLIIWLSDGGLRQQATRITVFPVALILAHPVLATAGLSLWIGYLRTDEVVFAWAGFGTLSASILLGFVMLTRWLTGRGGKHARGAEHGFPARVVALHGAIGLATFALVLITATMATSRG